MPMKTSNHKTPTTAEPSLTARSAVVMSSHLSPHPIQLGVKALDVLYEIGFEDGDDLTDVSLVDIVSVPGGGPKIAKEILNFRESTLRSEFSLGFTQEEHWKVLHSILSLCRERAKNIIVQLKPRTVPEFINFGWEDILSTRSCGRETFDQIFSLQSEVRKILTQNQDISSEDLRIKIVS